MMVIMRYPESHKKQVRARIVGEAAWALRQHGLEGVSIPKLMKKVGLTHGGFYAHFEDRDELVAEAVGAAAKETAESVFGEHRLEQTIARYLSPEHLEHPEAGCVLAALGPEGVRAGTKVRQAFAQAARGFLELTQQKVDPKAKPGTLSDEALVRAATLIGAVVLGRLVRDPRLAARVLGAARDATAH